MTKVLFFVLLLTSVFSFLNPVQGGEIYVPADYATIQEAVDQAINGDTIHVAAGTYYENVTINYKSISLRGAGKRTTVIDARSIGSAVRLNFSNQVTISGFTLVHAELVWPHAGVLQDHSDHSTIVDNHIQSCDRGIYLEASNYSCIEGNTVTDMHYQGVLLRNSDSNLIESNSIGNVIGNPDGQAVLIEISSDENIVSNNELIYNSTGIHLRGDADTNMLVGNYLRQCGWAFRIDGLINDCTIMENVIYDSGTAMYVIGSLSDIVIADNLIGNCGKGIEIQHVTFTISGNVFSHCSEGIWVLFSKDSAITENIVTGCEGSCLWIYSGDRLQVRDNTISSGSFGLLLEASDACIITDNTFSHSTTGIQLKQGSRFNQILNNTIAGCAEYGVKVLQYCTFNHIYYNGFSENQAGALDDPGLNYWSRSNPKGGNFWSFYGGHDLNGDGIGDSPLNIAGAAGSYDDFPLMTPHETAMLWANQYSVSTNTPGEQVTFSLEAAEENAFRYYLILGSLTGTEPGISLPGGQVELPLVWDPFTDLILRNVNTHMFTDFLGQLDADGKGVARFNVPDIPDKYAGWTIHFAYFLGDPGPFDYVSDVIPVHIYR